MSYKSIPNPLKNTTSQANTNSNRRRVMAVQWWASCNYRHTTWLSENYRTEEEAEEAARQHDEKKHNSEKTALVMNTGLG